MQDLVLLLLTLSHGFHSTVKFSQRMRISTIEICILASIHSVRDKLSRLNINFLL